MSKIKVVIFNSAECEIFSGSILSVTGEKGGFSTVRDALDYTLSSNRIDLEAGDVIRIVDESVVTLTANELAVLKAIDDSEYGDDLRDDVWTFTIEDNCDLRGKQISGTVSSLVRKELVTICNVPGEETIGMTAAGAEAYTAAVGTPKKRSRAAA